MPRHPEWFERLYAVEESLRHSSTEALGRVEVQALFEVSERDAIRLLHRFGAGISAGALSLSRSALLTQLDALRRGSSYQAFERQRKGIAEQLAKARSETSAQQFRVRTFRPADQKNRLEDLPPTILWRREPDGGRFEIRYDDGEDLLLQLAEFLEAAGRDRAEFFRGTEPPE